MVWREFELKARCPCEVDLHSGLSSTRTQLIPSWRMFSACVHTHPAGTIGSILPLNVTPPGWSADLIHRAGRAFEASAGAGLRTPYTPREQQERLAPDSLALTPRTPGRCRAHPPRPPARWSAALPAAAIGSLRARDQWGERARPCAPIPARLLGCRSRPRAPWRGNTSVKTSVCGFAGPKQIPVRGSRAAAGIWPRLNLLAIRRWRLGAPQSLRGLDALSDEAMVAAQARN